MSREHQIERLEEAMDCWLRYRDGGEGEAVDAFLARHEHLRDLLEPMVSGASAVGEGADAEEARGRVLGDFRLLREIGRGGMGVVFEAHQLGLDRKVAVKVLQSDLTTSAKAVVRFRREALTAARLEHRGIVDIYTVSEGDEPHWFAMELVEGRSLDEAALGQRETAPDRYVETVVDWVARVADALEHAHTAGVVHRDIKPSNILVRTNGEPVLTDFGLAREIGLPSVTHSGDFAGTPYYVSPEQVRGPQVEIDHRTDVFSLGVTLFELLTKRLPFEGESSQDVLQSILTREPPEPQELNPDLADDLAAVVLKALEKDPADRYQTAGEFAADLRNFLAYRPITAKRAGRTTRLMRWVRREPVRAVLLATLAVGAFLLAGLGGYVLATSRATRVGQQALVTDRVEGLLLRATAHRFGSDPSATGRQVIEAVELVPDDPYVVGVVAAYFGQRGQPEVGGPARVQRGLALLDRRRDLEEREPGLRRIRARLLRKLGRGADADAVAAELGEPQTALDHWALAGEAMSRWVRGEPSAAADAQHHAQRAVMLSTRPRSMYYIQLKSAAIANGDAEVERGASEALVRHWPNSGTTWCHMALAYQAADPDRALRAGERSLALEPDNFAAKALVAELEHKRGNPEKMNALVEEVRVKYPHLLPFLGGGHGETSGHGEAAGHGTAPETSGR